MNVEEVRNHDRRFSGDPPRKLTCLSRRIRKIQEMPELVVDILFSHHGLSD